MAFGRKKREEEPEPAKAVEEAPPLPPIPVTTGPYDVGDLPEDDESPRLDLGGIRVLMPADCEVRVDVSPEGHVLSAVVVHQGSQLQVNAFAAPRRDGIWDEVRQEIADSLRNDQGGAAEEAEGPFGKELSARIPTGQPGQFAPARFIGTDGPRWFLRGLITGPAATDPAQAGTLEEAYRGTVVVRGNEAMAPRDSLPLKLPKEAADAAAQAAAEAEAQNDPDRFATADDFNMFERGPEITETR